MPYLSGVEAKGNNTYQIVLLIRNNEFVQQPTFCYSVCDQYCSNLQSHSHRAKS